MGILRKAAQVKPEPVPRGFKTSRQWADAEGISPPHARRLIEQLCVEGKWEMRRYRVRSARGIYPAAHYGAVKKAKGKR
jgi:hypothetical protein